MKGASIGWRRLVLGLLGLGLAAGMLFVVMRAGPLAPTRVTVVNAAEGRLTPALFGIGTVEARRSYLIGPTAAGRVRAVAVDVGDRVTAGVAGRDGSGGSGRAHGRARRLGGTRRQRHGRR